MNEITPLCMKCMKCRFLPLHIRARAPARAHAIMGAPRRNIHFIHPALVRRFASASGEPVEDAADERGRGGFEREAPHHTFFSMGMCRRSTADRWTVGRRGNAERLHPQGKGREGGMPAPARRDPGGAP